MDSNPQFHVGITVPQQRKQINLSPLPLSSPSFRPSNHANIPFMPFDVANTAFPSSSLYSAPPFVRTEEEAPLLEELGINTQMIFKKTRSLLNPIRVKTELHEDAELSGPFIICMALGVCQLLSGKLQFGVILGWVCLASFFLYVVINMLAGRNGNLDLYRCLSFVGYCLLPLLVFSVLRLIIPQTSRTALMVMAGVTVIWCTRTCTTLLVAFTPYADQQRSLALEKANRSVGRRVCRFFNSGSVETEQHFDFIAECVAYKDSRDKFINMHELFSEEYVEKLGALIINLHREKTGLLSLAGYPIGYV